MEAILGAIIGFWSYFSPLAALGLGFMAYNIFEILNFVLQSIFFSNSIISILTALTILLGLTQSSQIITNKIVYAIFSVLFLYLHAFEFGDRHWLIHETLGYLSGFYLSTYVVDGCLQIRNKLDGTTDRELLHLKRQKQKNADKISEQQSTQLQSSPKFSILYQLCLMVFTTITIAFFMVLIYNIKMGSSVAYLHNNYRMLGVVCLSTIAIYVASILRRISLFLPALLTILGIYTPILINIYMVTNVYPNYRLFIDLRLPLHLLFVFLLSIEGKQRHLRQNIISIRKKYHINDGGYGYDKQYINDKIKYQRLLISSLFKGALCYYIYSMLHGNNRVSIQYMVVPICLLQIIRGNVK